MPRFANYLQDHMVLQRAPQKAVVWGFGDPKTLTTLTMNGKTYTTISRSEAANAQNESIWSVTLDPVSDEGPFDIKVSQPLANGTNMTIILSDVLFGDVWICSGQSDIQMTVSLIFNATLEIKNAGNYRKIRVFTASLLPSATPIEELLGISLNWSVASSKSIGGSDWTHRYQLGRNTCGILDASECTPSMQRHKVCYSQFLFFYIFLFFIPM